ncbi:MAG: hypothetical protein Q9196_003245 [Gyalolechia fulgens]
MPGASERLARDFNKILDLYVNDPRRLRMAIYGYDFSTETLTTELEFTVGPRATAERLVLFHCAFLALRSQDTGSPTYVEDHEIHGEKSIYAGSGMQTGSSWTRLTETSKIIDDNYEHALRVFRDRDSGGIRLQASVLRGEMKRTPVAPKIIHITDLQRYVFTTEYNPQLGPRGEHELRFVSSRDASEFMDSIYDLAGK